MEYLVNPLRQGSEVTGVVVTYRDITEQLAVEANLEYERGRLVEIFRQAPNFMAVVRGPEHVFEYANDAYYQLVGARELVGRSVADALPEVREQGFIDSLDRVRQTGEARIGNAVPVLLKRDPDSPAERLFVDFIFHPLVEADGTHAGIVVQGSDVTERWVAAEELRASRDALQYQSLHDALTGLPNRSLFIQRLHEAISSASATEEPFAVFMIDIDDFKNVNDTLGHESGDDLLKAVARRLATGLRGGDTIARLGGDEFGVVTAMPTGNHAAVDIANRLLALLQESILVRGYSLDVRASVGIATFPGDGQSPADLLRRADLAMYEAKRTGSGYALFTPRQEERVSRHLAILRELRHCIERDELVLHYQPKIELATGRVSGVEALLRWQHPTDGLLLPGEFIEQIEQSDLIQPVTRWVLDRAVRQLRCWLDQGLDLTMAVNFSARSLLVDSDLPALIVEITGRWNVDPGHLIVEMTESALLDNTAHRVLSRLNDLGVCIAIDDFGTGYSSLAYLQQLHVDELKVDQSFVKHMASVGDDAVIVRSTIDLAHSLGLTVVAEGVEDAEALAILERIGCDAAQGHHFTAPLTAEATTTWLRNSAHGGGCSTLNA